MNENKQVDFLIDRLIKEDKKYETLNIPSSLEDKKFLLRGLMNVRPPRESSDEFLKVQDEFLKSQVINDGIVKVDELETIEKTLKETKNKFKDRIVLWQGDITRLNIDAIVNAANSEMLGCFIPCHKCIDNAIHSKAGVQLRKDFGEIMERQGHGEPTGSAKLTSAYNLPSKYVLHTVGPIITGQVTDKKCEELRSCYKSCLDLAVKNNIKTIAFCCISTGEYRFPNRKAAEIAIEEINSFLENHENSIERIVINVFKDSDFEIYQELLR